MGYEGMDYSYKFTGYFQPPADAVYEFGTLSDDAAHLLLDGELLVRNSDIHGARWMVGALEMFGGRVYTVEILYGQAGGDAVLEFWWRGVDVPGLEVFRRSLAGYFRPYARTEGRNIGGSLAHAHWPGLRRHGESLSWSCDSRRSSI